MLNLDSWSRAQLLKAAPAAKEIQLRRERSKQEKPGGLIEFIRYFWDVLEPQTPFVEGWPLVAITQHLEAITFGKENRMIIAVFPGAMKSLTTDVFWPAWEWGAMNMPHHRYVAFSYSATLTERDNGRFRDLILSKKYQDMYGSRFRLANVGVTRIMNDKTGWKLASSVGGVATGERGTRIIADDLHSVKEAESKVVREETVRWVREGMSNRLNDMDRDAIVAIGQRVHEDDSISALLKTDSYCTLTIPMEYDALRFPSGYEGNELGWRDPRTNDGDLAWIDRFPAHVVEGLKRDLGSFAYASQYQQNPVPRGGAIIKDDWWQAWVADEYPNCEYVLASLDTAYTSKQENDPSALTIWGIFRDKSGNPKVILLGAWEGRLPFHELVRVVGAMCTISKVADDKLMEYLGWANRGTIKYKEMPRFPVDRLIIENKAAGISVCDEIKRFYGNTGEFGVELIDPARIGGDKVNRLHAVSHLFEDEIVYAPDTKFAQMVINNVSAFPKGAHDDICDTVSMGLQYMRLTRLLERRDEYQAAQTEAATQRGRQRPLYPV